MISYYIIDSGHFHLYALINNELLSSEFEL